MRVLLVLVVLLLSTAQFTLSRHPTTQVAAAALKPYQDTSPCPSPTPADVSNQQLPASTSNETIPGHEVFPVRQGKASFRQYLSPNLQLHLELVFKIRNSDQFQQCLSAINDPASPYYEHFLNATTLEPFLPTPGQRASVTSILEQSGFTVSPGSSPLVLQVNGTVRNVKSAFGLQLAFYEYAGTDFYAANMDPTLPTAFATLVSGIIGVDNFTQPKPAESPCTGPYCPQGVQIGYTISTLVSAGHDGTGQTVAVVDEPGDPAPQLAISTYSSQYGLPSVTLSTPTPDGTPTSYDPGWASEAAMDIEAVHSAAPGAGIALVYIPPSPGTGCLHGCDLMDAIDYVASNHLANVISNSWTYSCGSGTCPDTQLGSAFINSEDGRLATDVAQGVTIVFASGDSGSNPGGSLGTEFPSSDPNVVSVGATNLALTGSCNPTCAGYGSENGDSISGGGYSGYFSEPSWQTSTIGVKTGRGVPDVSMMGGVHPGPGIWVYSTLSDRCGRGGSNPNSWFGCSGTSLSTPLWAGVLAITIQVRGGGQLGNVNPRLYQLGASGSYSSTFHDITSGSNGAYSASTGWDPVTGWGTPQANNFAFAFAPTLTTNVASGSGSVSPNCPSGCLEAGGSPISVSASPSAGWVFTQWTVAGTSCSAGPNTTPCAFTMPYNSVTISATFIESTSISLSVSPQSLSLGASTQLSGSITPNPGSVEVIISESSDNISWIPIIFVNTNSGGAYSTSWSPPSPGNYGLQASWSGSSGFQGSTSSPPRGLRVTGTTAPALTLLLSVPQTTSAGSNIHMYVTIFNPTSNSLSTQITIQVLGPNSYVFFDTVNVQVAATSHTTVIYDWMTPGQTGSYTIIAQTLPAQAGAYDSATISVM